MVVAAAEGLMGFSSMTRRKQSSSKTRSEMRKCGGSETPPAGAGRGGSKLLGKAHESKKNGGRLLTGINWVHAPARLCLVLGVRVHAENGQATGGGRGREREGEFFVDVTLAHAPSSSRTEVLRSTQRWTRSREGRRRAPSAVNHIRSVPWWFYARKGAV